MKKLLFFITTCILFVVLTDICFGVFCNWYVKNKPLPGDYESVDYIIKRSTDSIIILGSSLALNSLIPTKIEDSFGLTCFNGAANGQDLPFFDTMMECMLTRYKPKMFILGLSPFQLEGSGIGGRYNFLVPYYNHGFNMIDSCLEARDKYEPYLLKLSLYRYNTIWCRILLYHFIIPGEPGEKGFVAKGIPSVSPTLYELAGGDFVNKQRRAEFISMAERCRTNGVILVIYFPPQYFKLKEKTATICFVENYCKEHDIPYFDDSQNEEFLNNKEWFYDNDHLNKNGAQIYTTLFIKRLMELR